MARKKQKIDMAFHEGVKASGMVRRMLKGSPQYRKWYNKNIKG